MACSRYHCTKLMAVSVVVMVFSTRGHSLMSVSTNVSPLAFNSISNSAVACANVGNLAPVVVC